MKRIGVLTSGGDAPGMNAAIRAVVRTALYHGRQVSGIMHGYQGLMDGHMVDMDVSSVGDIIHRGGTKLLTARCDAFKEPDGPMLGLEQLKKANIDGLVVIGGDGTFQGAKKLADLGFPTIGIPGTIDNDLAYTDYTIGFDTAINTVVHAISNIRDTSSSHGRCNIIEVMGRHCGDIALHAAIAGGAETVLIPEVPFDLEEVVQKLVQGKNRGKLHSIILLAEGVGHPYELADALQSVADIEARVSIIGYLQRGGTPSAFDRLLASRMGARSVEILMQGKQGRALGIKGDKLIDLDISEALTVKKEINKEFYYLAHVLSI